LIRNVARYGGGGAARPPVDRFTDHELTLLLKAARDEHFFPILLLLARTGLRIGEACGLRWRDLDLTSMPPRLTVVWQLDRWGGLVHPKTATSRRTIPLRAEVATRDVAPPTAAADDRWLDNVHGLVFTTRNGRPVDQRNVGRAFHRARTAAGVDHGSLKTFRSTVATQLAEAGLHPSKTQAFLGHAHVTTTMTYYTAITTSTRPPTSCPTCLDRPTAEPRTAGRWATRGPSRCRGSR
jgi:integrase